MKEITVHLYTEKIGIYKIGTWQRHSTEKIRAVELGIITA